MAQIPMNLTPKVFLGGTCNNSSWRHKLTCMLKIDYFNPVVDDWTPECQEEEIRQRKVCDYVLYCFTPRMTGCYAVAEVVDDSNKRPASTIMVILRQDTALFRFDDSQWRSLNAVANLVRANGGCAFDSLEDAATYLNGKCKDTL